VQNAKILLLADEGNTNRKIAVTLGINPNTVHHTISKFTAFGVEKALTDLHRSGRPCIIDDEAKTWVISQACIKPVDLGYSQELWTISKLTAHIRANCVEAGHDCLVRVARSKVWKILDDNDLKPHRIRYYLEKRDENFDEKLNKVLELYKGAEQEREKKPPTLDEELLNESMQSFKLIKVIRLSYDEKPGIQAIQNVAPDLSPTLEHGCLGRDYEYKRLGTVSLLAALNLGDGSINHIIRDTHKSSDFINLLEIIDNIYPKDYVIEILLDNHSSHTSKETMRYLNKHPGRFKFIFTPKHGSWLNLIESFFGKLSRVCLKGMRVNSKEELIDRINRYIQEVNDNPVIYHWKYKMDELAA
jgi:transposase